MSNPRNTDAQPITGVREIGFSFLYKAVWGWFIWLFCLFSGSPPPRCVCSSMGECFACLAIGRVLDPSLLSPTVVGSGNQWSSWLIWNSWQSFCLHWVLGLQVWATMPNTKDFSFQLYFLLIHSKLFVLSKLIVLSHINLVTKHG